MKHRASFLAAIALVVLLPSGASRAAETSCALQQLADLPITLEADGLITVPASMNGMPTQMTVDTGSVYSSISAPMARRLGLTGKPAPYGMLTFMGGVPIAQQTEVADFALGGMHGSDVKLLVQPVQLLSLDSGGLLGPDVMKNFDIDFDFFRGRFKLFSSDHCPGQVVYWPNAGYATVAMDLKRDNHIAIEVTLDGERVAADLDTGAARSFFSLRKAKSLFDIDDKSTALKPLGDLHVNSTIGNNSYTYPFHTLNFGGVTVNNPDLVLLDDRTLNGSEARMVIGMSILRQLHLYIAYKEEMLYITPAEILPYAEPAAASAAH